MIDWSALLRESIAGSGFLAIPAALAGGVLTGLNPCCLPIYPAAAAACCAGRECFESEPKKLRIPALLALALGLATATTTLGIAAAIGGRTIGRLGGAWVSVLATVPLLAGAHFLGFLRLPLPLPAARPRVTGVVSAFLAGFMLALIFGPCGTPLLAGLLSVAAYDGRPVHGGLLLFAYGLGIAIPVALLGGTAAKLAARLDANGWHIWVNKTTGILLVGTGLYLLWSAWSLFPFAHRVSKNST
jgi:cytochrome c biogenesis protein CcdA